ncbi:hypothetical protein KSP40_PGU008442 [Platanthera guangdongensis]|uniref:Smr domain-containing protein n=1 Tax=Platanthera guangdongensis TaxID=2320717 RepID=A0ABR2LRA3_9ASPA
MHRPKFQTAGWAAFDRDQREKQGIKDEGAVDPCPSISKETSSGIMENTDCVDSEKKLFPVQFMQIKSFSSVVRPTTPVEFPLLESSRKFRASNISAENDQHVLSGKSNANPVVKLKDVHNWADQHLIEDILAAVKNDVGQASICLNEMASFESNIENVESMMLKDVHDWGDQHLIQDILAAVNNDVGQASIVLEEMDSLETENKNVQPGSTAPSSSATASYQSEDIDSFVHDNLSENSLKDFIIKQLYVPSEPEFEEDDVYLSHRKEALKMMRAASQHSQAASNAYLRGDHLSAQQLSVKARDEWLTAEKLNLQAAEEILCIRNSNNDLWKLDLHGLHATEAVHALMQHLKRLEFKMMLMNHSSSLNEVANIKSVQGRPSFDSPGGFEAISNAKGNILPQQRQTLLHVITGAGKHSKGQAALPIAVKSFLIEEGYRFEEARPGIIFIHPKFRGK